jgi:hypothetical protein
MTRGFTVDNNLASQTEEGNCSELLVGVVLFIATLSVAEGQANAQCHYSHRRNEHHKNSAIDGSLGLLGSGLHSGVTHGATLRESWRGP